MKKKEDEPDFKCIKMNPLNKSTSKQLYSFPKSSRFNYKKKAEYSASFYEIKNTVGSPKKGVSFGAGNKVDFSQLGTKTPGPGHYEAIETKTSQTKKNAHTMGSGRQQPKQISNIPPVGSYEVATNISQPGKSPRFGVAIPRNDKTCSPGPGTYEVIIKQHSKSVILKSGPERKAKSPDNVPGPQQYQPKTEMSPKYMNAAWQNCKTLKFSKVERFKTHESIAPGPGKYQIPGEFGIY